MKYGIYASRNRKELLRDPFSLLFGIGLPIVLLLMISAIQRGVGIPIEIFKIENFTPGITMFSFSFISLFSGMLIAKDRSSSFLTRLFASPLSASDYIIGYSLPLLSIALLQCAACFITAFMLGLPITVNVLYAVLALLPSAILFIGLGLFMGSIFTDKQASGLFTILVQVAALSSGMWFDLDLMGGVIKTICYILPFAHAVDAAKAALAGNAAPIALNLAWVSAYALLFCALAVAAFRRRMRGA